MKGIRKGYNFKIAVLMLGIVFLCNNILYSCPIDRDMLRVPSIFQNSKHDRDASAEPKTASKLAEASEALSIIADHLRAGEIVIFGDMHRRERTSQDDEIWDRELFLNYVEQLGRLSMNFSVALELPYQLENKLNDSSVSVEVFLDEYYKLLSDRNSAEFARLNREIRGPYLSRLLNTLKRFNIPIILIDDINSQRRGGLGTDINVIEQSNRNMAQKLLEERKKYSNGSVLLMVGRNHVVPKISPIWLGGRDMNSIPGVLRELGVSVKLVRPDDFQYDKEDLVKFDLIIKREEIFPVVISPSMEQLINVKNIATVKGFRIYLEKMLLAFSKETGVLDNIKIQEAVSRKAKSLGIEKPWTIINAKKSQIRLGVKEIARIIKKIKLKKGEHPVFLGTDSEKFILAWNLMHKDIESTFFNINAGELLLPNEIKAFGTHIYETSPDTGEIPDMKLRRGYVYSRITELLELALDVFGNSSESSMDTFSRLFYREFTGLAHSLMYRRAYEQLSSELGDRFYNDVVKDHDNIVIIDSAVRGVQPLFLYAIFRRFLINGDERFKGKHIRLILLLPDSSELSFETEKLIKASERSKGDIEIVTVKDRVLPAYIAVKDYFKPVSHRYLEEGYDGRPFKMRNKNFQLLSFYSLLMLYQDIKVQSEHRSLKIKKQPRIDI